MQALPLRIALRYLIAKKSHRAINVISAISVAGVAVATMAIVVVLSVFNGFAELSDSHLSHIDPDLQLRPVKGKTIAKADSLALAIETIDGVAAARPCIEERAMLISDYAQLPIVFKAVTDDYHLICPLDSVMVDGAFITKVDTIEAMQISVGVANRTGLRPSMMSVVDLYVPRRHGRINPANPLAAFTSCRAVVSGVFQTDQADIDNDYIYIPLGTARNLLGYSHEASSIDIAVTTPADIERVGESVAKLCGSEYDLLTRRMQQQEAYRMIEIEKWVTFMMLMFILVIASFNIISTLSLMIIEKRDDSSTLMAMGASRSKVQSIFSAQAALISISGGIIGIIAGVVLSLIQQHFGLIKLAGDPAALTIDVYPVAVSSTDILAVTAAIFVVALLVSLISRLFKI